MTNYIKYYKEGHPKVLEKISKILLGCKTEYYEKDLITALQSFKNILTIEKLMLDNDGFVELEESNQISKDLKAVYTIILIAKATKQPKIIDNMFEILGIFMDCMED